NPGEEYEFDPMDIDLPAKVLFKLMKEEIFQVIFAGQVRRKPQEGCAAHQEEGNEGNDDTQWGHSDAPLQNKTMTGCSAFFVIRPARRDTSSRDHPFAGDFQQLPIHLTGSNT